MAYFLNGEEEERKRVTIENRYKDYTALSYVRQYREDQNNNNNKVY